MNDSHPSTPAKIIAAVPASRVLLRTLLALSLVAAIALGAVAFVKLKEARTLKAELDTAQAAHRAEVRYLRGHLDAVTNETAKLPPPVEPVAKPNADAA